MNSLKVSRIVLRAHGSFLLLLTALLIALASLGTFGGIGVMAWLQSNPTAYGGLFQAYALMMIIGGVLWIGSFQENTWIWDLIGLLAHIPPLLALFMLADVFAELGLPSTVPLHSFFILLELLTLLYYRFSMGAPPS
jgi:hypothetical protein